ncbi:hypothetical protein MMC22_008178 [Lobaria immixta]|nr:hypothetical protein [Lobaria immixta]
MSFHLLIWFFVSLAISTSTYQVPSEIIAGSSASAIQGDGNIRIYYQANDSSLHEWRSYAPNSLTYVDTFLVPAYKVKDNSPLAAAQESTSGLGEHSFYFIAPDNLLRGFRSETGEGNWSESRLNNANFTAMPGSRYLYAVAVPNGYVRVGYQCISGSICEASSHQNEDWHTREI